MTVYINGMATTGDMLRAVYDPDLDGIIALAQLVAAVCSETELANAITAHLAAASHLAFTELAGGEDYRAPGADDSFNDWDLSGIIGVGAKVVLVGINIPYDTDKLAGARKNGSALDRKEVLLGHVAAAARWDIMLLTECDASRIIEVYRQATTAPFYNILGYWS